MTSFGLEIRRSLKGAAFRTPQVIPVPAMPSQVIQKGQQRGAPASPPGTRRMCTGGPHSSRPAATKPLAAHMISMRTCECAGFRLAGPQVTSPQARRPKSTGY